MGNRVIFASLIYFLFARIDANKDYTFIPKINQVPWPIEMMTSCKL